MKVKKTTFDEGYTLKGTYQKENGYYTHFETTQNVPVVHGVNEKNNHEKAKELFIKANKHLKDLKIHAIIYQ